MRVSAKAEYACIAMVELAARQGDRQPIQIRTIAQAHDISDRFLVQILLQMKGAGLVVSSRGAAGGYQLARAADAITLAEIVNLFEPPTEIAPASTPKLRAIRGVWKEVHDAEQRILEGVTLADLIARSEGYDLPSYQI